MKFELHYEYDEARDIRSRVGQKASSVSLRWLRLALHYSGLIRVCRTYPLRRRSPDA